MTTINENKLDISENELLNELEAEGFAPCPIRPIGFGITVNEFMKHFNCSEGPARNRLEQAVKAGKLVKYKMNCGVGATSLVFSKPGELPGD